MTLGETIKKYRKLKGLTQKELGEKIGRTQRTIQAYEKGEVIPPLTIIDELSNFLGIETYRLLDEKTENIKNIPPYDEIDLEKFALKLNKEYLNSDNETKKQIKNAYNVTINIYNEMINLTEKNEYIYDFNKYIHDKAPLFKILSTYEIEELYKNKIKSLKEEKDFFNARIKDLEEMIESQKEIISLQKDIIKNLKSSNLNGKEGD